MKLNPLEFDRDFRLLWETENRYIICSAGRGTGKSFVVNTFLTELSYEKDQKILFTRWTMKSASLSIIPEFLEKIVMIDESGKIPGAQGHFRHVTSEDTIYNLQSGSSILFRGMKTSSGNQTAALKSINAITTWVIEEGEELIDEDIFDTIDNSIRKAGAHLRVIIIWNPTNKKHWIWKTFFKHNNVNYNFTGEKNGVTFMYSHYENNAHNLNSTFIDKANKMKAMNPKRFRNIYLGEPSDDVEFALWKQDTMIDPFRITLDELPDLRRIVVGLDPNVSDSKDADDAGIVVVAEDFRTPPHYYVLKDASGNHSPLEWAQISIGLCNQFEADAIVAEVNNGGDLVVMTIKGVASGSADLVNVKKVRASRGKITRAEPVSALYEEGRVHHVGVFEDLEDEMTTYTGLANEPSPGRYDAMVWGITDLSGCDVGDPGIRQL